MSDNVSGKLRVHARALHNDAMKSYPLQENPLL